MKRVGLFLSVPPNAGGMFQYSWSLLDALTSLSNNDYAIEVVYIDRSWESILSQYRVPVTFLAGAKLGLKLASAIMGARMPSGMARALSCFNPVVASLRRLSCDIWIFPAQDAISYQLPLTTVVAVHDLMHRYEREFPEIAGGPRFGIREHRFRNIAHSAKGILVDSDVGRLQVVEAYGVDPKKVYPLPYIPPRYIFDSKESDDFDLRYGLPAKFIFYPAQFWGHKNHHGLISAAASIKAQCPDLHLVFTGERHHLYESVHKHARRLGILDSISFLGYICNADLPGLYRRARAMVMPTFLGPTNIPPLEAFACDCPVAVSRIYAMPEQLGDAAIYFDPRSIEEMAAVIAKLWLDDGLCNTLRERGRAKSISWNQRQFNMRFREILSYITRADCSD